MLDSVGGINSLLGAYGNSGFRSGSVNSVSSLFDYQSSIKQSQSLMSSFQASQNTLKSLKKDSAAFLDSYTKSMNTLGAAAKQLDIGNINGLMYNKQGEVTEETIKSTVDAAQSMVDAYNESLTLLNKNAQRGNGVMQQLARMSGDPAPEASMKMLGITVNKDATLSLDTEKLTKALSSENIDQRRLFTGLLSDVSVGVQRDVRAGLNTSAGKLINNDLAEMQGIREEDPFIAMVASIRGGGAYALNNQAVAGMMMNMLA